MSVIRQIVNDDLQPSPSELDILKLFWRHGALSARELHVLIADRQEWSISTTRTILERMRAKGLLSRSNVHGMGVYVAARGKVQTLGRAIRSFARDMLEVDGELTMNAFSGSAVLSDEELAEIERMLNEAERSS